MCFHYLELLTVLFSSWLFLVNIVSTSSHLSYQCSYFLVIVASTSCSLEFGLANCLLSY